MEDKRKNEEELKKAAKAKFEERKKQIKDEKEIKK